MRGWGTLTLGVALAVLLVAPAGAAATGSAQPLGLDDCGPVEAVYACSGHVSTWDKVPLDTTVVLPRAAPSKPLPLVVLINGFGNSKYEYLHPDETAYTGNAFSYAREGYAVLTYTARGLWGSCGTPDSRLAGGTLCAKGYIHLADVRYEVRDAQHLIGRLVDDRTADPGAIGVAGDSYGGGQTLMLAALRDRVMLPGGRLIPWRSPAGTRLRLAAAAPVIPWSDLLSAAAPNGLVSATGVTPRGVTSSPLGVSKTTFINAIFAAAQFATGPGQPVGEPFQLGRPMGFLAPPGIDRQADVASWVSRTDLGEPYTDPGALAIVRLLSDYHSAYNIDPSSPPPPLLLSSGFTDDLVPSDEVLRYANRTRRMYPEVPLSLLLGDFGHQRAANKAVERRHLIRAIHGWFDHYLKGERPTPRAGVTAYAQTCPRSELPAGPFRAPSFAALAGSTIRYSSAATQTVSSLGIDPTVGLAIDPATGGGDGCVEVPPGSAAGTARYRLIEPTKRALTILGQPRLAANLSIDSAIPGAAQLAGRLWDVAPSGNRRLIARGSYRPVDGANRWYLHPAGYRLDAGHALELELLGADIPYTRPSNGLFSVEVADLRAVLPTR